MKGLSIRNLKVIDSTTIQLFSEMLQGVGRKPLDGSRRKDGVKVHAMMDAVNGVTEFVRMTATRVNDKKFLYHLKVEPGSWLVFDKAYTTYQQFAKWTSQRVWFVTRMKDNAVFHVTKVMADNTRKKNAKGLLKEQYVTVAVKKDGKEIERLKLRRIIYKAEDGKVYVFMTNNFTLPTSQIATIYKNRWMIEILFKQIKQNFPLRYFWGEKSKCNKDADILCAHGPVTDGSNPKKVGYEKVIC